MNVRFVASLSLRLLGIVLLVEAMVLMLKGPALPALHDTLMIRLEMGLILVLLAGTFGKKLARGTPPLTDEPVAVSLVPVVFFVAGLLVVAGALTRLRLDGSVAAFEFGFHQEAKALATLAPSLLQLFIGIVLMFDCRRLAERITGARRTTARGA